MPPLLFSVITLLSDDRPDRIYFFKELRLWFDQSLFQCDISRRVYGKYKLLLLFMQRCFDRLELLLVAPVKPV